jgi:serine/threonine protein kinase, bacterial
MCTITPGMHATLPQGTKCRLKMASIEVRRNINKEQTMTKFTQTQRAALIEVMIAGLSGCGEEEKKAPPPPPPAPLTVGGTISGLAGEVVLQINGADDLAVKANGKFKFPKALKKGATYAVTVKTQPSTPVKQTCKVADGGGTMGDKEVGKVAVNCTTNEYAVGGTVSGLAKKSKGLVLDLNGGKEVEITKNGDFVFPETRLPDGGDFNVAIKSTPKGQKCEIESINTAPDSDTVNIVSITCSKKGGRK